MIVHAGDIGRPEVLTELEQIAPVVAVRGNNDTGPWARSLPETRLLDLDGWRIYLLHDVNTLTVDPSSENIDVVIAGHSHRAALRQQEHTLYLNPGSAGPRRFTLPISVARLRLGERAEAEILTLSA